MTSDSARQPILITGATPIGFGQASGHPTDLLIGADGRVAAIAPGIDRRAGMQVVEASGKMISPGWTDLHVHVWHGGTDISIRPTLCGIERGVTTLVDAGSAGEANFEGFREFVIDPARERIRAFLNIGSIGLVACNRVSELSDISSIDIDRTITCVEANRDVIIGLKVRASRAILGSWGMTPVRIAKKVAKILKLPLMVHVGAPPPIYDEVLEIMQPGDIITHCFNGRPGGSILDDEDVFQLAQTCAQNGVRLDVGHGNSSFSFRVAEVAIRRGLLPFSISTDLHKLCLDGPVFDMATTMSKLLGVGMPLAAVIEAATNAPRSVLNLSNESLLEVGAEAEFTVFDVCDVDLELRDSIGGTGRIDKMIEPLWTIFRGEVTPASRYVARHAAH